MIQLLPVTVVAPRYFAGAIESGVIWQSVGALNRILSDLSIIVNQFEQLLRFSAGIDRLSQFFEAMRGSSLGLVDSDSLLKLANATKEEENTIGKVLESSNGFSTSSNTEDSTDGEGEDGTLSLASSFGIIDLLQYPTLLSTKDEFIAPSEDPILSIH